MGKRFRYIILTFTVVLAVFAFAMLWQVRPGFDSKVLDEARARQEKTLLEVSAPLKTDIVELTAEEEMAKKVSGILMADESFISGISEKLEKTIPGYVEAYTSRYTSELDANIRAGIDAAVDEVLADSEISDGILRIVDDRLDEREAALIERITTDVWNTFEARKADLVDEILAKVETVGAEMIGEASDETRIAVLNEIYGQEDYFVELVADAFADGMYRASNGEIIEPYSGIAANAADGILGGLAGNGMTSEDKTRAAIENIVMHVLERIDMADIAGRLDELEKTPAVESRMVEEKPQRVPEPARIAVPPKQEVSTTVPTTSEEYENERARLRKAEIDRVLSGLMRK